MAVSIPPWPWLLLEDTWWLWVYCPSPRMSRNPVLCCYYTSVSRKYQEPKMHSKLFVKEREKGGGRVEEGKEGCQNST